MTCYKYMSLLIKRRHRYVIRIL